jgi:uncharacterized protein (TIGR03067 family)
MRRLPLVLVLFALACSATAQLPEPKKKSDQELIKGTWRVVALESGGKAQSEKAFSGNTFEFAKMNGQDTAILSERAYPQVKFNYSLDPNKSPKEINLATKGNKALGIYKLDGDDLTICVSLGGARPVEFVTRAGGDTETFTLKRSRWERYSEKGLGFTIEFPGRPTEAKRPLDGGAGQTTIRVLAIQSDQDGARYSVTIVPLNGALTGADAVRALDEAQKPFMVELGDDARTTIESQPKTPAGVSAARELTISRQAERSRDRGTMRVRLYVVGERLIALAVSGTEESVQSSSVTRFWNSFRMPPEKRKDFPNKQR